MTVQEAKTLFAKIATKVVNHDMTADRSHFFMADADDFNVIARTFLDLRKMSIDVSYPIENFRTTGNNSIVLNTSYVVNICRIVEKEDFNDQALALDEALSVGLKFIIYLHWIQRKYNNFGLIPNSRTTFNNTNTDIKPLIDDSADFTCGRQFILNFETPFNFCDENIQTDVKENPLWN